MIYKTVNLLKKLYVNMVCEIEVKTLGSKLTHCLDYSSLAKLGRFILIIWERSYKLRSALRIRFQCNMFGVVSDYAATKDFLGSLFVKTFRMKQSCLAKRARVEAKCLKITNSLDYSPLEKGAGGLNLKFQTASLKNPISSADLFGIFRVSVLSFLLLYLSTSFSFGQDLSNVGKAKPITVDGGISATQVYYESDQASAYRKPYSYTVSANLNFAVFGWAIPVSAVYSNNRWNYQQPFNQFSLSPSYKWIQTHIGYASMSFSPYTLNGQQFLGGGVDLAPPGNFKISAMAGRMQKRVLPDSAGIIEPAYYRFGSGLKSEYTFNGGSVSISTFYAKDDKGSLAGYNDSLEVKPQENLSYSLAGNINKIKNVNFSFEIGQSLLTEDMFAQTMEGKKAIVPGFAYRTSTHRYTAYKLNSSVNTPVGSVGLGYERVDPGYKTLGAYYSTNDFENITFNYAGRAFKEKITLAFNTGIQRDDLDNTKQQQNKRVVSNVNLGLNLSQKLNMNFNYSNFSSYTNIKSAFDNINNTSPYGRLDTLDFTQLTENYGGSVNFNPGSSERVRHGIMASLNFQKASDKQADNPAHAGAKFYNSMAGYNVSFTELNLSMGVAMNYNRNIDQGMTTETFGPTLSSRKTFFDKKMNASMGISYNNCLLNGNNQSEVYVTRAGLGYVIQQKHYFDLNGILALRNYSLKHEKHHDITVTLTYRYNFSLKKAKTKEKPVENQGESYNP